MSQTIIQAKVIDQALYLPGCPKLAAGGINEIQVAFTFCGLWEGFAKTAVFFRDKALPCPVGLNADGTCIAPPEAFADAGTVYISVYGQDNSGVVRTSEAKALYIAQGFAPWAIKEE